MKKTNGLPVQKASVPRSTGFVKLYNLKRGEKFYDMDGIACEFLDCVYDPNTPDVIKYRARQLHFMVAEYRSIYGQGAAEREYLRCKGRDRSSYMAGFTAAMKLCTSNMGKFDLENAGLDNPVSQHLKMLEEYVKWKKNIGLL
jgi:hypothetical protein